MAKNFDEKLDKINNPAILSACIALASSSKMSCKVIYLSFAFKFSAFVIFSLVRNIGINAVANVCRNDHSERGESSLS